LHITYIQEYHIKPYKFVMGPLLDTQQILYLDEPITEKATSNGESPQLKYATCEMQGWRNTMEDAHLSLTNFSPGISLFGVFDGHGGIFILEILVKRSRNCCICTR